MLSRRNTVLDRLEMCDLSQTEEKSFYAMRNKDFNSIFPNISRQGIAYPLNSPKSVIDSDYSPEFNPFTHYFEGNARWDRKTDHIRKLADTIQAEDREFWREGFRRWIVAMVASALRPGKANQEALVLHGAQGKGKKYLDKASAASGTGRILPKRNDRSGKQGRPLTAVHPPADQHGRV